MYGRERRYARKDGHIRWGECERNAHPQRGRATPTYRVGSLGHNGAKAGSEERLERQARQVALRAGVSAALAGGGTLSDILRWCVEAMGTHLGAAFARIWILDEEEDVLELRASPGMYTHTDGFHSRVPLRNGPQTS
jgi:hypothetical protein